RKTGSRSRPALHLNSPSKAFDDAGRYGQPQTGALAGRLGGKKRVEYPLQVFFRDTAAIIQHIDAQAGGRLSRKSPAVVRLDPDGKFPAGRHGVATVE